MRKVLNARKGEGEIASEAYRLSRKRLSPVLETQWRTELPESGYQAVVDHIGDAKGSHLVQSLELFPCRFDGRRVWSNVN